LAAALLAGCATLFPSSRLPEQAAPDARVTVQYVQPRQFSEWRDHPREGDGYHQNWMNGLQRHVEARASRYLAPGAHLLVQFTDVALAGAYEPWRGAAMNNVRIVRDVYPPRIDLAFRLTGADGKVLRQGRRELRDPAFLMRSRSYPGDALGYEKAMLDDWLSDEFGAGR